MFSKARRSPHLSWQVIEANGKGFTLPLKDFTHSTEAMMEYHWNKEAKVATNVFELGLKTFSENVDYVGRYLDFLISTNDDTSMTQTLSHRSVLTVSCQMPVLFSNEPSQRFPPPQLSHFGSDGSAMRVSSMTSCQYKKWTLDWVKPIPQVGFI